MKRCTHCGETKTLDEFYRDRTKVDGRKARCRSCYQARAAERYATSDQARATSHAYYVANRDRIKAAAWAWQRAHPTWRAAQKKKWRQRHPEPVKEHKARWRAAKAGAPIDRVDYRAIRRRDQDRCYLCGELIARDQMTFDHVVPLSKGGPHAEHNIRMAHLACNLRKGDRPPPTAA